MKPAILGQRLIQQSSPSRSRNSLGSKHVYLLPCRESVVVLAIVERGKTTVKCIWHPHPGFCIGGYWGCDNPCHIPQELLHPGRSRSREGGQIARKPNIFPWARPPNCCILHPSLPIPIPPVFLQLPPKNVQHEVVRSCSLGSPCRYCLRSGRGMSIRPPPNLLAMANLGICPFGRSIVANPFPIEGRHGNPSPSRPEGRPRDDLPRVGHLRR